MGEFQCRAWLAHNCTASPVPGLSGRRLAAPRMEAASCCSSMGTKPGCSCVANNFYMDTAQTQSCVSPSLRTCGDRLSYTLELARAMWADTPHHPRRASISIGSRVPKRLPLPMVQPGCIFQQNYDYYTKC